MVTTIQEVFARLECILSPQRIEILLIHPVRFLALIKSHHEELKSRKKIAL